MAGRLIDAFGSLGALLAAPPERQARDIGDLPQILTHLAAVRLAMLHILRGDALSGCLISGTDEVAAYLRVDMAYEPEELVRVLFLASDNGLIADEVMFRGTIDQAPFFPRPIVHRALDLGAAALIIVHNHPSGVTEPSRADLEATRGLAAACKPLDIIIHDHIVVGRSGWTSLRSRGLI